MVRIIVGQSEMEFQMHKGLLCNLAPCFKAVFEPASSADTSEQSLTLPEVSAAMFNRFQLWAYTGSFYDSEEKVDDASWNVLIKLWIFGHECGIASVQNAAIDGLVARQELLPWFPYPHLQLVYDSIPKDAHLRRLFVNWATYNANKDENWFKEETKDIYPKHFLFDLAISLCTAYRAPRLKLEKCLFSGSNYYVEDTNKVSKEEDVCRYQCAPSTLRNGLRDRAPEEKKQLERIGMYGGTR